jgi:1-pyrroline-5-carboxylate dehydrogenase
MSAHGFFRPPDHDNEPVLSYAPGTPERAELRARLRQMESERISIPMIIGGKEVYADETFEAVEPHRKSHVLADVAKGGAEHVEQAIAAANAAHHDWARMPWHERAAIFLRAAELLSGPWRSTLNAATMLNQSKTAHQAEIDAVCEMCDFWRYNVDYVLRIYSEQPHSPTGVWNRMEYRPLEGFVFAVSPFNFTCIGGNLSSTPALMGCTIVWKPASTAALSAYYYMRLLQEAGLPDGVINLVYGSGATVGSAALASPDLAGIHFTGSTAVFNGMWETVGENIGAGVHHGICGSSARPAARTSSSRTRPLTPRRWPRPSARLVRVPGQKGRGLVALRPVEPLARGEGATGGGRGHDQDGRPTDFENFMGAVIDANAFKTHADAIAEANRRRGDPHGRLDGRPEGYFVSPTVITTEDKGFRLLRTSSSAPS